MRLRSKHAEIKLCFLKKVMVGIMDVWGKDESIFFVSVLDL